MGEPMADAEPLAPEESAGPSMFVESNPIPVKWAMQEMGLIPSGIRLPLTPLSAQHHPQLLSALQATGVLGVTEQGHVGR